MRVPILFLSFCLVSPAPALAQTTPAPPAPASAQEAAPESSQPLTTLKLGTRVVAISAVVKDKTGQPTGGLSKDDFVLRQDGKEEPIRYFSQGSELPLTFAVMVDTSGSQRTFIGDETLASDVFFETMLDDKRDRATLVQFDNTVLQLQPMTNSAKSLHLGLMKLRPHAATVGGTLLDDAVFAVAKGVLANETGRRAMVILTDGGDNGSRTTLAQAIEQAQRADVQIYSVYYSVFNEASGASLAAQRAGRAGLDTLQKLSEATGGHVFEVTQTTSLRSIFNEIGEDLRLQYELGYTPPPDTPPNSYHKLELRAKDKRLNVQARKGFFAQP